MLLVVMKIVRETIASLHLNVNRRKIPTYPIKEYE
jgi:hypothetical protein